MYKYFFMTILYLCLAFVVKAEITDISQYQNVVYAETINASAGSEIIMTIKMKNSVAMTGFQFDISLPSGISVATDSDGFHVISLCETRTTVQKTNYFDYAMQRDGSIRIMASSTKNLTFSGSDGEVCTVKLNINSSIIEGNYPIFLKNIVLSDANSQTYEVEEVETTINITKNTPAPEPTIRGDVNGDGKVDICDITELVNIILHQK